MRNTRNLKALRMLRCACTIMVLAALLFAGGVMAIDLHIVLAAFSLFVVGLFVLAHYYRVSKP